MYCHQHYLFHFHFPIIQLLTGVKTSPTMFFFNWIFWAVQNENSSVPIFLPLGCKTLISSQDNVSKITTNSFTSRHSVYTYMASNRRVVAAYCYLSSFTSPFSLQHALNNILEKCPSTADKQFMGLRQSEAEKETNKLKCRSEKKYRKRHRDALRTNSFHIILQSNKSRHLSL